MTETATETATGAVIEVTRLTKAFGPVRAVDDLSFTVEPGMVTGFLGPNGAGKTTTLRMLLGVVRPDAGAATIGGRRYRDIPEPAGAVGAVLDATGFHPTHTGHRHLQVYCTANGYPASRADALLELVGLTAAADRRIGGYSLGMRQRLALATALLGDPEVLVLDEPANGLDPKGIVWIRRLLRDLATEGRTMLVSSHVLTEMQHLVDRVVIIDRGRCVYHGSTTDLSRTVDVRTRHVDALRMVLDRAGARARADGPDQLEVTGVDAATVGRLAFAAGLELSWLAERDSDLEQLFLTLTSASAGEQAAASASGRLR